MPKTIAFRPLSALEREFIDDYIDAAYRHAVKEAKKISPAGIPRADDIDRLYHRAMNRHAAAKGLRTV